MLYGTIINFFFSHCLLYIQRNAERENILAKVMDVRNLREAFFVFKFLISSSDFLNVFILQIALGILSRNLIYGVDEQNRPRLSGALFMRQITMHASIGEL